jgi:hypothetical protein
MVTTTTEAEALGLFPAELAGSAAGLFFTFVVLGGALGAALTSYHLSHFSDLALLSHLSGHMSLVPTTILQRASEGTYALSALAKHPGAVHLAASSFRAALDMIAWIYAGVAVLGIVLTLILPKK